MSPHPTTPPQRRCLGCHSSRNKRELIRLVRTPQGGVEIDPTGKRPGRGAYFCPNPRCWKQGLKGQGLERALRTKPSPTDLARLRQYALTMGEVR